MKKLLQFALLFLFAVTLAQADPLASGYLPAIDTNCAHSQYASNIWMTDTMQKVRQDSGSPASNACYLTVYATQNEFADFQVHFHDTGSGTSNLSITVSNFVQTSPASSTITASTNVVNYREAYMNVTTVSGGAASNDTFYGTTGYYPDILIPTVDPYFGQTTNAWPFTVAAGKNQSAWIDVLIPPSAPSGYYLGSITVKSGSTTLATMPVIIAVWQWPSAGHMPSTATLKSVTTVGGAACGQLYGGYSGCSAYPGAGGGADTGVTLSTVQMTEMILDHRYSAMNSIYPPYTNVFTGLQTYYGPLLTGLASTMLSGAEANTAAYAPNPAPPVYVQNWETEWVNQGYAPTLYYYSFDEPSHPGDWAAIIANATPVHASTPQMPALVTTNIANATTNSALNSIDIMVPVINDMDKAPEWGGGGLQRSTYNTWLAGNCCGAGSPTRQLWSYQSNDSQNSTYPNYYIDGVPAANRAMEWMTFLHTESGELYYDTTYAWTQPTTDPWNNVYFFGGNGDGTLIYPSTGYNGTTFTNHVTASGGGALANPIFLPSIRLEHIRDGMQDYEYLNVLTNNGKGAFVTTQINSWITNSWTFETSGSGLEAARSALGTAMHQLTYPTTTSAPATMQGIGSIQGTAVIQ